MNVDNLREIHLRLCVLIQEGGGQMAIKNQLDALSTAIEELADRPQTYIKPDLVHAKYYWTIMPKEGYYESPLRRPDGMRVMRLTEAEVWYADFPDHGRIKDTLGRKRTWKSAGNAMAYLDRDYPMGGDWRSTLK